MIMTANKGIVRLGIYPEKEKRTAAPPNRKREEHENPAVVASIEYFPPPTSSSTKSNKDLSLELKLKEAINAVLHLNGGMLIIDSNNYLEHFKENIFLDYLRLIGEANIDFKIVGLDGLTKDNIGLFISIYEQKKRNQSKALSAKEGSEQKKTGQRQNKAGVEALTSDENLRYNKLKKRQISDLDPNNIQARKLIRELKEEKNLSDYRISKELNEMGVLTSRNSRFQANTVKRQYDALKEVEKRFQDKKFHINEEIEEMAYEATLLDVSGEPAPEGGREIPIDYEYEAELADELILAFNRPLEREITVDVFNNEKENIFSFNIGKGENSIVLNLLNDTPIGPGRYYGRLCEKGAADQNFYKPKWITFIVRKDVISSDSALVSIIPASDSR